MEMIWILILGILGMDWEQKLAAMRIRLPLVGKNQKVKQSRRSGVESIKFSASGIPCRP